MSRPLPRRSLLAAMAAAAATGAASPATSQPAAHPLPVVASFSILGDIVREIGGDDISAMDLIGPDSDAHVFEPSPADLRPVAEARLFVVNGLGLEGWLSRLTQSAQYRGPIVVASTGVAPLPSKATASRDGSAADPHAWQDPRNVRIYAENIRAALAAAAPARADAFRDRFERYDEALKSLDARVHAALAPIPAAKRRVITTHDAFAYYGHAYEIEFIAPLGISTDSQPSALAIAELIRQIRREGIKALFLENISDPRLIEELARETGATLGPPLYSDALSRRAGPAPTYLRMIDYNTTALAAGMMRG